MVEVRKRISESLDRLPGIPMIRSRPVLVFSVALAVVLLVQWVRLGKAYLSISRLDPQIESLSRKEEPEDEKEEKENQPDLQFPEVSQNIFHRSHVSYSFSGMIGDQAIVSGSLVRVGDRVKNATVEEISPNRVKLRTDEGQVREMTLFNTLDTKPMESKEKKDEESQQKKTPRRWAPSVDWLRRLGS